jgi:signal transduction histidine kinase
LTVQTASGRTFDEFWDLVLGALKDNDKDIMFAMVYTNDGMCSPASLVRQWNEGGELSDDLVLRGLLGIPAHHSTAVQKFSTKTSSDGMMPWFRKAGASGKPVILRLDDDSLPDSILEGIKSKEYGDPCRAVVISPLRYADSTPVVGFLIVGSNPRTSVDSMYVEFIEAMTTTVGTYMGSLARFGEVLALHDASMAVANAEQAKLSEELKDTRLQVIRTEKMLRHFVETSQVGVFIIDKDAKYIYRNQGWSNLTNESIVTTIHQAWDKIADPEFIDYLHLQWDLLFTEKTPRQYEFKTLKVWEPNDDICRSPDHEREHRVWLLISAFPDLGPDGEVLQVLGSVTDISALKWANKVQQREADDALESKRRLENFIDTTNHELRNPLSAVILAGDDIMFSVQEMLESQHNRFDEHEDMARLLTNVMENGRTIVQCAKHQKRIVDDVLTASKLDARLLEVSPSPGNPKQEILDCIRIFDADANDAHVMVNFSTTTRYDTLGAQTFMFDTTRFMQIFINLLTNAIKFTRFEETRRIDVTLDISLQHPAVEGSLVKYMDTVEEPQDPTASAEWTNGPQVYVITHVTDTGKGLTPHETENLFSRFRQASPKTHVQYGGSGLGLFISRRLAELQGGAIGMTSEAGVGSTFAFYIKSRVTSVAGLLPHDEDEFQSSSRYGSPVQSEAEAEASDLAQSQRPANTKSSSTFTRGTVFSSPVGSPSSEKFQWEIWSPQLLCVLVVEDNLINQKMLAEQLRKIGCTAIVANHGAEALEQIQRSKWGTLPSRDISVVLMDWEMPVMDGLTAARTIRTRENEGTLTPHIPIIGVTANVRQEQLKEALDAGMVSFCYEFHFKVIERAVVLTFFFL